MMGAPGSCDHESLEGFPADNGTQRAFIAASRAESAPEHQGEIRAWLRPIGCCVHNYKCGCVERLRNIAAADLSHGCRSRSCACRACVCVCVCVCVHLVALPRHADNGARWRRRAQIVGAHPPSDTLDVSVPCLDINSISDRIVAPDPLAN